jgi:tocopherol O-methyltransferase
MVVNFFLGGLSVLAAFRESNFFPQSRQDAKTAKLNGARIIFKNFENPLMPASILNERIRKFYDRSTPVWLDTWGEHMHHGFYGHDGLERKDHRQAQLDLVEELLRWGGVTKAQRILDAGCGVGGSARYLSRRFGATVLGLTLSPVQAVQAEAFTDRAGLAGTVRFQVRDMMQLRPEDGPFELIWSMESAEHVADKPRLFEIFHDLLAPGGRLLMATWCHRAEPPALLKPELKLLEKIYGYYHLPPMVSPPSLSHYARNAGFTDIETADWSRGVAPFWPAVIRSALRWQSLGGLLRAGLPTIRGAWAMRYMTQGYRSGLIEFAVLQARKEF